MGGKKPNKEDLNLHLGSKTTRRKLSRRGWKLNSSKRQAKERILGAQEDPISLKENQKEDDI